jgi:hypothetical protein
MANAMLQDDFKSSHQDLSSIDQRNHGESSVSSARSPRQRSTLTTRKSVEFAIQPPPFKRVRPDGPCTPKAIVDGTFSPFGGTGKPLQRYIHIFLTHLDPSTAIGTCVTRTERWQVLQNAKDAFNHNIQASHDDELRAGADAALTKHFAFLIFFFKNHSPVGDDDDCLLLLAEISLTMDVLESLYRASSSAVGASFERLGSELMQVLVMQINAEIQRRTGGKVTAAAAVPELQEDAGMQVSSQDDMIGCETSSVAATTITTTGTTPEGDLLLRKATKILGHFARVGEATQPMAHYPGLLNSLLRLCSIQLSVPWEARLSALWILANLACNAENMQMMACTPGLIESLVQVSCRPLHSADTLETTVEILRSRSIASRAILNLSWSPENKVSLAERAALVELLATLTVSRTTTPWNHSRTVREILLTTRRHAVGALRNLAAAPRRIKIGLCDYRNGYLLDILTDAALNDPDTGVKDRAFAAIHNLAIHDTAETIVSHPALVLALKDVLLSEEDPTQPHEDGTPKSHAAATLLVLERSITPQMDSYENLRDLLEAVNPNPTTDESDSEVMHEAAV